MTATNETKHTPGPWEFEPTGHGPGHIAADCEGAIRDGVATVWGRTSEDTFDANARLIAAAPDLLAACKGLIENIDNPDWSDIDKIRAAIARAEGAS